MTTTTTLNEDTIYRTSTQYRLWSFSPQQLAARRRETHELALARARQYTQNGAHGGHLEYITEEEELRLIQRYCQMISYCANQVSEQLKKQEKQDSTSIHWRAWKDNLKATAIQYLKRFYLSNSCMTYPPAEIYKTVMFMASKTEAVHITAQRFAHEMAKVPPAGMAKTTPEELLAPEYKIIQALRFTLEVRQPFRGLTAVKFELLNMAEGKIGIVEGMEKQNGKEIQDSLFALEPPSSQCSTGWEAPTGQLTPKQLEDRIKSACGTAGEFLNGPASITDAYFLYTPSQILLAAMQLSDEPLTSFYLDTKISTSSAIRPKILGTIQSCAELLAAYNNISPLTKDERAALEEKLEKCRDPTTKDMIKNDADMKRGGAEHGKVNEQDVKRRKLERENSKADDPFGPALATKTNGHG